MESLIRTSAGGDAPGIRGGGLPVADAQKNEAMLRTALYLRSLGLRDHDTIHRLVGQILEEVFAHAQTLEADGHDLLGATLQAASARTNRWLDTLLARAGVDLPPHASRGMMLMRLRPLLTQHPQAYERPDDTPEPFLQVLRAGGMAVVPPVVRTEMDPQAIGELPEMMSGAFWRRLVDRLRHWSGSLFATLSGR